MFNKKIFIFFLSIFFLFFYGQASFATEASIVNVHDGDTVTVKNKSGKKYKIRLFGIDAPELAQPYGNKSKKHLAGLLKNQKITYKTKYRDTYGRSVATIFADGRDVNQEMVEDGYAWHYKQFSDSKTLAMAEEKARKNKLGLWKDKNPTQPWSFRREQKHLPNVRNDPFFKSPIDNFFVCINPKTFYTKIQTKPCGKGYYTAMGRK